MKLLLLGAILFSGHVFSHDKARFLIQKSETILSLIYGVEQEYGVKCEELKRNSIKFYRKKVNSQYTQPRYKFGLSCSNENESSVFINIDGSYGEEYQLVESIKIGFAG